MNPSNPRQAPGPPLSLRLLYAEDSPADAEMALLCLKNEGIEAAVDLVQSEEEFAALLAGQEYDCILADYRLGSWTGRRALEIIQEQRKKTPFILVTGTLGDELAVEIIKMGAADYVLKDRLSRLPMAIRRALEERKMREGRARAEGQLRLQAAALDSAANAILVTNRQGEITWANPAFTLLTGYSLEEAIGKNPRILNSGAQPPSYYDEMWKTLLAGQVWRGEVTNRRKDGSLYEEEMTITPVPDAEGEIAHFIAIKLDVTDRKRAEGEIRRLNAELEQRIRERTAELAEANATLESILDAATQVSIIATDPAGVITAFNPGAEQLLGYSAGEMTGKMTPAVFHLLAEMEARGAELSERYGRQIHGFDVFVEPARQGGYDEREWTYVRKDGSHLTVSLSVTARQDSNGNIIGFLGIAKDLTARKRAEEERDRFFTLSLDMLCIAGFDGYFKRLNPAWEKTLGFTTEELLARPYLDFIHPDDREVTVAEAAKLMTGADTVSFENRYLAKDGSPRWFLWSATPFPEQQLIYATARDITERKRIEGVLQRAKEDAERVSKFKDQFLSTMSHELRTPLNAVMGFSDLLRDERYGPLTDKQRRYVNNVHTSGQHLLKLINDILDLSKIEAGRMELAIEDVPLKGVFSEVAATLAPLLQKKALQLAQHLEPDLAVRADATRLKQMLMNLVGNAIKFIPEGGSIELRASPADTSVAIEVRDNGPGIPRDQQSRIFEAFQRLRRPGEGSIEGTGLGLAITARLAAMHGSELKLDSEPGRGSRFYFSLPAGLAERSMRKETEPRAGRSGGESLRILMIEDDPVARQLIYTQLTSAGYQVVSCDQPRRAVELAQTVLPDVITLDMLMEPVNGWEVLLQLKGNALTANIPVVVVTVVDQPAMGVTFGAEEYLVKPVEKEMLLSAVRRALAARAEGLPSRPILVVEDEPATREMIAEILTSYGYAVAMAADGEEARQWMSSMLPELVILDLMLPKVSGFQLLAEWRSDPRTEHLPVFVLSGKDLTHEEEEYLREHTKSLFRKKSSWQEDLIQQVRRVTRSFSREIKT